jgi:uncharacterized protein (DUF4415 family)
MQRNVSHSGPAANALGDLDAGRRELPKSVDNAFLKNTELTIPGKQVITIRLDGDVLDWFKRQGRGYQTRINKLLRSYMEANRDK